MTSEIHNPIATDGVSDSPEVSLTDLIHEIAAQAESIAQFTKVAVTAVMNGFQAMGSMYRIEIEDRVVWDNQFSSAEAETRWTRVVEAALLDATNERRPHARHVQSKDGARGLLLSLPIGGGGALKGGALALVMRQGEADADRARLAELQSLLTTIEAYAGRMDAPKAESADDDAVLRGIARAASYENLTELAFALTNNLRVRTGSEQVFFGIAEGNRVRMLSLSGVDDPNLRSSATLIVRQAMEECLDHGSRIIVQREDKWNEEGMTSGHFLHRRWHESTGGAPVASFPMMAGSRVVGVVAARREHDQPFAPEEVARIEKLVEPLGMGTLLQSRASRSLGLHGAESVRTFVNWVTRGKATVPRIAFFVIMALMLGAIFGRMDHNVASPAELVAQEVRIYASPFDSVLREVRVRAGDQVEEGEVLAVFDTEELDLQALRWAKEVRISYEEQVQLHREGKESEAQIARLRGEVARYELQEVMRLKERSTLRAGSSGIVLDGEAHLRVGESLPQGETLMRVAHSETMRIEVAIPEDQIDHVSIGMEVRFATRARPEEELAAKVLRIKPQAEVRERRNVFVVECELPEGARPDWLRPGMEGVGSVEVGTKPIWWLASNRVIDWLRLEVWF